MRLFFALPLPSEVKETLRPLLDEARKVSGGGVGFTKPEQLHFTLAFLGEQPGPEEALAAGESLREVPRFELVLSGVGAFPSTMRPRVLWIGVTGGAAELIAAAERLQRALRERGFTLEERKFRPHLTLGRVRPQGERGAKRALAVIPSGELARCSVRGACLMQSVLGGRTGATHTVVRMFPFR
jgi:RNA 2',3'-cyclic 3'-phosphodiesterase